MHWTACAFCLKINHLFYVTPKETEPCLEKAFPEMLLVTGEKAEFGSHNKSIFKGDGAFLKKKRAWFSVEFLIVNNAVITILKKMEKSVFLQVNNVKVEQQRFLSSGDVIEAQEFRFFYYVDIKEGKG